MLKIDRILESPVALKYMAKWNLFRQYDRKKKQILSGQPELADLKLREPKRERKYYFRINKQYRVHCRIEKKGDQNILYVLEIDNHQN